MTSITPQHVVIDDHSLAHLLYGMMLAFPLFLVPTLFALMINCAQKSNKMGELLYSHIRWQRFSMLGLFSLLLLAYSMTAFWCSTVMLLASLIWFCHRTLKGWLALIDRQAI